MSNIGSELRGRSDSVRAEGRGADRSRIAVDDGHITLFFDGERQPAAKRGASPVRLELAAVRNVEFSPPSAGQVGYLRLVVDEGTRQPPADDPYTITCRTPAQVESLRAIANDIQACLVPKAQPATEASTPSERAWQPQSVREARARAKAERAYRKASRPWILRHWLVTGIGVLILIGIIAGVASSGSGGPKSGGETAGKVLQHPEDVTITRCFADQFGFLVARVKVTNHSSKASDYDITVAFETKNGRQQIATGYASFNSVQAGQTAVQTAEYPAKPRGPFVCKLADAARTQSF